jgi:hypothetical protein
MFPVRYELNSYILFRRNSVFKGLKLLHSKAQALIFSLNRSGQQRPFCKLYLGTNYTE